MSSIDERTASPNPERIYSPYCPDPNRPEARRREIAVYVGVPLFCLFWGAAFAFFAPELLPAFILPCAILGGAALWALPDTANPPVRSLAVMLFMFMVTLVMWPNYIALALPGLPWITMNRLSGLPLVLILVYCVGSFGFRVKLGAALKSTLPMTVLVTAFIFIQLQSIAFSEDKGYSIQQFINSQIALSAIFFTSVYVFLKPGRAERMIRLMWIMSILVGIVAIFEFRAKHALWRDSIPSWLQINDPVVIEMLDGAVRNGAYRCSSTFGNPLTFGEYLSLVMPFVANYAIGPYRLVTRIAAAVSIPYIAVICYITGSRLALVGCFLCLAFTVLAWAAPRWLRDRNSFLSPLIVMSFPAGFLGAVAASFLIGGIRVRVWGSGRAGTAQSNEGRRIEYMLGIPKLLRHPEGFGIGMAAQTVGFMPGDTLTIDSYYLSLLMDYGPIGFVVFCGIVFYAIYYCINAIRRYVFRDRDFELFKPLTIALVNFFIIKSVCSEQANHPIVFMFFGMICALTHRVLQQAPRVPEPTLAPAPETRGRRLRGVPVPAGRSPITPGARRRRMGTV